MDTDKLNKWLTLVANLGVIAGIVFLALEIRQSNRIAVATSEISIRQTYGALSESVMESPEMAEVLFKAQSPDANLSGAERVMGEFYIAREFNTWGAVERAHANGMTSPTALEAAKDDIRVIFESYPGLRYAFEGTAYSYPANSHTEVYRTVIELLDSE